MCLAWVDLGKKNALMQINNLFFHTRKSHTYNWYTWLFSLVGKDIDIFWNMPNGLSTVNTWYFFWELIPRINHPICEEVFVEVCMSSSAVVLDQGLSDWIACRSIKGLVWGNSVESSETFKYFAEVCRMEFVSLEHVSLVVCILVFFSSSFISVRLAPIIYDPVS